MLQEESDLSLVIAQIVQKLKGSSLYAQLERQAWVSVAERRGQDAGPLSYAAARLRPSSPRRTEDLPPGGSAAGSARRAGQEIFKEGRGASRLSSGQGRAQAVLSSSGPLQGLIF